MVQGRQNGDKDKLSDNLPTKPKAYVTLIQQSRLLADPRDTPNSKMTHVAQILASASRCYGLNVQVAPPCRTQPPSCKQPEQL